MTFKRGLALKLAVVVVLVLAVLKLAVVVVLVLAVLVCVARGDSAGFNHCSGRDAEGSNSKRRHINMELGIIVCDAGNGGGV